MNNVTNWENIFDNVGFEDVYMFANGSTSARHFEGLNGEARRLVRNNGARKARQLAQRAINRRLNAGVSV